MNLEQLKAAGGLVPSALVPKDITWTDSAGNELTFTIHVRRLSYGESVSALKGIKGDGIELNINAMIISACVRLGENADEKLSYHDAIDLEPSLGMAMHKACNEVNGLGDEAKKSQPTTNSGASSSSRASAAKPLRKRKKI